MSSRGRRLWLGTLLAVLTVLILVSVVLFGTGWYAGQFSGTVAGLASLGALALFWLAAWLLRAEFRRSRRTPPGQPA